MDRFRMLIGPDEGANIQQLCVRAVVVFVIGVVFVRISGRRTFSHATPLDIVVALIAGSNLSRVMTGRAPFWPAVDATLVLVVLHRILAMATLHWNWLAKLTKAEPVVLVRDGVADRNAMLRHGIGHADLLEGLRLEQAEHLVDVRLATLENSGKISVVRRRAEG
ncbi:MAG: DUF421 domain-containing protein [Proteobacteria bacterium]|nr:DUF421 domain-containing protein [Pseudomonadota bacterium]